MLRWIANNHMAILIISVSLLSILTSVVTQKGDDFQSPLERQFWGTAVALLTLIVFLELFNAAAPKLALVKRDFCFSVLMNNLIFPYLLKPCPLLPLYSFLIFWWVFPSFACFPFIILYIILFNSMNIFQVKGKNN